MCMAVDDRGERGGGDGSMRDERGATCHGGVKRCMRAKHSKKQEAKHEAGREA